MVKTVVKQLKDKAIEIKKKKSFFKDLHDNREYLLMIVPGVLQLILFNYLPLFGLILAFKTVDYSKSFFNMDWNGFKNFEFLFKNPDVFTVLRNTLGYNLIFIVTGAIVPVAVAVGLSLLKNKTGARAYQSFMFLPYFLSWIIVSYLVFGIFDYRLGIFNNIISGVFGREAVNWYQSPRYWPTILVLLHIWKTFGYNSIIYFAAIMGIDSELYEAASIDGAGVWKQVLVITIPSIKPVIVMLAILAVGKILNADFGMFYNVPMGSGALMPVTNVLDTFVYNALKINGDIAMATAAGFFQSVVGFVLVLVTNHIVNRIDSAQALF